MNTPISSMRAGGMTSGGDAKEAVRLILVDDHGLVRAGLRALLDNMPGVDVVAEAGDGRQAIDLIGQLKPDIVLTDIAMPHLTGLGLLRDLRSSGLPVKVILLSMHDNDAYVAEAIQLGASGYLVKSAAAEELGLALHAISRGDIYLSARIAGKLAKVFNEGRGIALTDRQNDVLRLIARGASSKEIARSLNLSIKTVETHRSQLMDRLDIHDLAGLVRYAVRTGLIGADE